MNILFDMTITQPTSDTKFIGSGEYAIRILTKLLGLLEEKDTVKILYKKGSNKSTAVDTICRDAGIEVLYYSSVQQISSLIRNYNINVVFFPLQYPEYEKLVISDDVKIISVLHDLAWIDEIEMQSHYGMELGIIKNIQGELSMRFSNGKRHIQKYIEMFRKSLAINNNQTIITVSEYSKEKICRYIGIHQNKVKVLYSPSKIADKINDLEYEEEILRKYICEKEKYILLISASRWRKNVLRALEALNIFFFINSVLGLECSYRVLVLGADDEHRKYFEKIVYPKEKFTICDYVSKEELEVLYKNAGIFMYASLLEGFGYPPLEAMKYGTACICSKSMSIPEVCGSAAVYFNGFKRLEMVKALFTATLSENRKILKKRAIKRYKEVSIRQERDLQYILKLIIQKKEK